MVSERNTILVALGMGLLAGLLAAIGIVVLSGATSVASDVTTDGTTPDLLPGVDLVTEEVEPGVYRVLGDGVDDLSDLPDLEVPIEAVADGECGAILVEGECWFNAYGMLVREVDGEFPLEQVPDAEHGLTFPTQEVIGPLPGSGDTGWLVITGPTGFQGLLAYGPQGWTRVPYAADEDGQAPSIETGGGCGVVLGPGRYPGLVGPDGTAWVYTLEREGLHVTAWDGDSWSSFGPVDIGTPDVEDPCLLLDAAFGPNGTMWFTTRRIPLYVISPKAVATDE